MGTRDREYPEGHPNARRYELVYKDGERYTYRQGGRQPIRQWDLADAVMMANQVTSDQREIVSVVDPQTGTVMWVGEVITR